MISEHVEKYKDKYLNVLHTGSQVICNPAPTGTDDDYILLVHPGVIDELQNQLSADGFGIGGSLSNQLESGWQSWKKLVNIATDPFEHNEVIINVILTCSDEFFESSDKATRLSKALNLRKKEDRITVFKAIREDVWPE